MAAVQAGADDPALAALFFTLAATCSSAFRGPIPPLPAHLTGVWNDNVACRIGVDVRLPPRHQHADELLDRRTDRHPGVSPAAAALDRAHAGPVRTPRRGDTVRLPGWVAHIFFHPVGLCCAGLEHPLGMHPTGGARSRRICGITTPLRATHASWLTLPSDPREAAEFFLAYLPPKILSPAGC